MALRTGWLDDVIPPRGSAGAGDLTRQHHADAKTDTLRAETRAILDCLTQHVHEPWSGSTAELAERTGIVGKKANAIASMILDNRRALAHRGWRIIDHQRDHTPRWTVIPPEPKQQTT